MLNTLVRKLIEQLMKFGIVGVIAFVIDWGILNLLVGIFHMHNVLAATVSFIISLIFNYLASMKFVFKHRDDMARWMPSRLKSTPKKADEGNRRASSAQ